jgi:dethiobiotin synthetase
VSILVVTGTGTGVGKTIATAALAAAAHDVGIDVAVCKPVQTGLPDDDLAEVARLAGVGRLVSLARYPEPLAPVAAAELAGQELPSAAQIRSAVRAADRSGGLTLVEGAGGLLVEIASGGTTLRDLAIELEAPVLVVCQPGLGTLNHTALTVEALDNKGISCAGLVIGSWPAEPGAAERYNRVALGRLASIRAVLPAGASALSTEQFATMSREAFDPDWVAGLT